MGGPVRYQFGAMPAPSLADPAQMAETYVASTLTKSFGRHAETYALGYETFFLAGDTVPCTEGGMTLAGGYYDINNAPTRDATSPDQREFFSDCPDGMSLLTLPNAHSRRRGCKLSRILSCPAGAETSGLHAVDDVNGFSCIMSNFQHPGDQESSLHDKVKAVLDPLEAAHYNGKFSAAVGYPTIAGRVQDA